jgi:acetyl esterase/lipase
MDAGSVPAIPLWDGVPPGGGGPTGAPERTSKGALSNVVTPVLEVFVPERPNGSAAVIAGGGGYKRIQMESEAYPAARWLAARGITAFVLSYRLPAEGWAAGPLAPLQDAQRAIRLVHAHAARYGIDTARILALGFSAGGHLMGMAAARHDFRSYPARDAVDEHPARVALAALLYPVVTLRPPYDHTSTRRVLVGEHPSAADSAAWSVETWIRPGTPPLFAVQAADDPIADPANLGILFDAARRAGIAIESHRLPSGGHGFGMGKAGTPSAEWPAWFEPWLRQAGLMA